MHTAQCLRDAAQKARRLASGISNSEIVDLLERTASERAIEMERTGGEGVVPPHQRTPTTRGRQRRAIGSPPACDELAAAVALPADGPAPPDASESLS